LSDCSLDADTFVTGGLPSQEDYYGEITLVVYFIKLLHSLGTNPTIQLVRFIRTGDNHQAGFLIFILGAVIGLFDGLKGEFLLLWGTSAKQDNY